MGAVHAKSSEVEAENVASTISRLKASVHQVHIDGLGRTKDDVVQWSIKDVFGATDIESLLLRIHEARLKLSELGCFKGVNVYIDTVSADGAPEDSVQVTFEVTEINRLGASVNTSVGTNEGSVNSGGKVKNVFGRGERIEAEGSYGNKKTTGFHASFVKPFHKDRYQELEYRVFQNSFNAPWSGFGQLDRGMSVALSTILFDTIRHSVSLEGTWRHVTCLSRSTAFHIRENAGHSLKTGVRQELQIDRRDHPIFPSDGIAFKLKNDLAGLGGDVGFLKNEIDLQVNLPSIFGTTVQLTAQGGHLMPIWPNKTWALPDRFLLGGPTSVRGFEAAGVGPHSDGCALGDQSFWAGGLHVFSPLPLLKGGPNTFSGRFRLHGFINGGNIADFTYDSDNSRREWLSNLLRGARVSYGAGLALDVLGLARVELNYCWPLIHQKGDRHVQGIQFGISTNFL